MNNNFSVWEDLESISFEELSNNLKEFMHEIVYGWDDFPYDACLIMGQGNFDV